MKNMNLGAFSISLSVKDVKESKAFYEKLGFVPYGGNIDQNWIIMKNGNAIVGLFQGMFEKNVITFNPGWDENARTLDRFTDVREIQEYLKSQGIELLAEADVTTTGPANITMLDPDGNPILIDQHVG